MRFALTVFSVLFLGLVAPAASADSLLYNASGSLAIDIGRITLPKGVADSERAAFALAGLDYFANSIDESPAAIKISPAKVKDGVVVMRTDAFPSRGLTGTKLLGGKPYPYACNRTGYPENGSGFRLDWAMAQLAKRKIYHSILKLPTSRAGLASQLGVPQDQLKAPGDFSFPMANGYRGLITFDAKGRARQDGLLYPFDEQRADDAPPPPAKPPVTVLEKTGAFVPQPGNPRAGRNLMKELALAYRADLSLEDLAAELRRMGVTGPRGKALSADDLEAALRSDKRLAGLLGFHGRQYGITRLALEENYCEAVALLSGGGALALGERGEIRAHAPRVEGSSVRDDGERHAF